MNELVITPGRLAPPKIWMRDWSIFGALSCFGATAPILLGQRGGFVVAATIAGLLTGALFGPLLRRLVHAGRYLPVPVPFALVPLVGGVWGALVGGIAAKFGWPSESLLAMIVAAIAATLQVTWFWLPYTVRSAKKKRTWPLTLGGAVLGPLAGYGAVALVIAALGF